MDEREDGQRASQNTLDADVAQKTSIYSAL